MQIYSKNSIAGVGALAVYLYWFIIVTATGTLLGNGSKKLGVAIFVFVSGVMLLKACSLTVLKEN